jgi:DNA (cytosine-5)-methyltransferase 1
VVLDFVAPTRQNRYMSDKTSFRYIDLFAGCGGLSLGLESEGGELVLAVERSDMAAETFFHNLVSPLNADGAWKDYIAKTVIEQVQGKVLVKELRSLLDSNEAMESVIRSKPDLVVGGPPCQGFSLAGRRNPDDIRNQLPWQFLELVERTQPKMVVIENVVGMRHKFSADDQGDVFNQLQNALRETSPGYVVQGVQVNALHYGAPQHRPRLMIIGLRSDVAKSKGVFDSNTLWSSRFLDELSDPIPALAPIPTVLSHKKRTVGEAINNLQSQSHGKTPDTGFAELMRPGSWGLASNRSHIPNHVPRVHQETTQARFRLYQYLSNQGIDARVVGIPSEKPTLNEKKAIRERVQAASFPALSPDGQLLASNLDELVDLICSLRTKKHSQRVLSWNEPARTVVTIGDDYVHPFEPRTFTVRELARFQGFPDDFEFRAKETTGGLNRRTDVPQYSQVGNAVSPFLAKAVGKLVQKFMH